MPARIDLRNAEDPRDVVHRAVQALAEGKLVVFPTETVYGMAASALNESAVAQLLELRGPDTDQSLTLAIKSADDALDYVPELCPLGRRLARRCWPGPVTLVLDHCSSDSTISQLPEMVQKAICPDGSIGLRVPAHDVILSVLRLCAGPLVLTSASRAGQPEALDAEEALAALGKDVALIVDDGRAKFAQPSSVVRVRPRELEVLRAGVITPTALKRLASLIILMVCTGNTCRSPMAEAMLRRHIAERLGCKPEELEDQGVMVMSAGIAAMAGGRPAPEAVQIMGERGLDIASHESQPLTDRLVRFADLILTMTRGHLEAILTQWPDSAGRVSTLSRGAGDVADPIGGPPELYRRCAEQIDAQLQSWVQELDLDSIPTVVKS